MSKLKDQEQELELSNCFVLQDMSKIPVLREAVKEGIKAGVQEVINSKGPRRDQQQGQYTNYLLYIAH